MDRLGLFDTYKRYKVGQNKFTTWLKQTADKCGYGSRDKLPNGSSGKSTGKQKNAPSNKIVRLADFVGLAKAVVAQLDSIPRAVIQTLKDVINQRKKASRHYGERTGYDGSGDDGHIYMIKALEEVLAIFESIQGPNQRARADPSKHAAVEVNDPEGQLRNLFALLEIEGQNAQEDSNLVEEHEENNPRQGFKKLNKFKRKGAKSKKSSNSKSKSVGASDPPEIVTEYEMETDDSEIYFLVYCYFEDFNDVRNYLQERWCDYREGIMSLSAVAVATNTAFDIFQRGEKVLLSQIPRRTGLTTYEALSNLLFLDQGLAHVDYDSQPDDPTALQQAMYEEADWIGLPVYWDLSNIMGNMGPTAIPIVPPPDPLKGKGPHNGNEMIQWGRSVLMELISELGVLKGLQKNSGMYIPGQDELTRGMIELLATRNISIWIVFACKVYIDIRYVLGEEIGRGQQELLACGTRMKSVLTEYLEFSKHLPSNRKKGLKTALDDIEYLVIDDCFNEGRAGVRKAVNVPVDNLEPYFYFRRNPILCGLLIFRFDLVLNQRGLETGSIWGAIMGSVHLYNAVRHEVPDSPIWKDIETVIEMHGAQYLFVGELPGNAVDYCRRFELAIGAEPTKFPLSDGLRHEIWPVQSDKESRPLEEVAKCSHLFYERLFYVHKEPFPTLDNVEIYVEESLKSNSDPEENVPHSSPSQTLANSTVPQSRSRADIVDLHCEQKEEAKLYLQVFGALMPVQILGTLIYSIEEEAPCLSFDYFSLHMRCTKLLRALDNEFQREIVKLVGSAHQENRELMLMQVVRWILLLVAQQRQIGVKESNAEIQRVGTIMELIIEGEGNLEIEALKSLMGRRYTP